VLRPQIFKARRIDVRLLLWTLLVGLLAGFLGASFRLLVGALESWCRQARAAESWGGIAIIPITGLAIGIAIWLVRRFAPEASGSGVQEMEGALDGVRPLRWRRVLPIKFAGGLLSLGFGMVLGREGPTIQMGGNLGAMVGQLRRASADATHVLVAAGAGAGLTAAFHAPFAGILFVIEEMRPQFRYSVISVQAVVLACAAADVVVQAMIGGAYTISIARLSAPPVTTLWLFLVFGATFGLIGYAFNRTLLGMLSRLRGLGASRLLLVGGGIGLLIGALGPYLPSLIGGGHGVLEDALNGRFSLEALLLLFAGRFALTILCYGSGAPGGVFAPMLALGTLYGMAYGHLVDQWLPDVALRPELFAVAGMGALFAATVRAPLTGILLTAEVTGDFQLILPLMLTCLTATLVAHALGGEPLYTSLLRSALGESTPRGETLERRPPGEESIA